MTRKTHENWTGLRSTREHWCVIESRREKRAAAPTGEPARRCLSLALAQALQSKALGGITKSTDRKLCELAAGSNGPPPGTRISRSWQGKLHIVTVTEEQKFNWQGRDWDSLSVIARTITGTRWSGPAFFGTRARKAA